MRGWLARPAKPPGKEVIEAAKTALPEAGSVLRHVATVNVGFEGQGWAWDRTANREIWLIASGRSVVATHVPPLP